MAERPERGVHVVGKSERKVDGVGLVEGRPKFVADLHLPETLHVKILGSPRAHATIVSIDPSEAEKMPGVACVLTHENTPDIPYGSAGQGFPEPSPYDQRMFPRKMRHVGDRVAAVVAETVETAEQALGLIEVEYEVQEPVLTIDQAKAPGAPVVHNEVVEYVAGAPADLDNSTADERDGRLIYQFPIGGDPHRNLAASVSG